MVDSKEDAVGEEGVTEPAPRNFSTRRRFSAASKVLPAGPKAILMMSSVAVRVSEEIEEKCSYSF
jgi:hypothetical protein